MDTRQLKVGQIVAMRSGYEGCHVIVLEITSEGCIVEEINPYGPSFPKSAARKIRFDIKGYAAPSDDLGYNDGRIYPRHIPGPLMGSPWVREEIVNPEQ